MKSYKAFYEAYDRDSLVIKDGGVFDVLYDIWWDEVNPYIDPLSQPDTRMLLSLIAKQPGHYNVTGPSSSTAELVPGQAARPGFRVIGTTNEFDFHVVKLGNWPPSDTLSVQDLEDYKPDKLVMLEKVLGETGIPTAYLFKGQRWLMSDVKKWWFKNLQDYNTYNDAPEEI